MTVKELIEALNEYHEYIQVIVRVDDIGKELDVYSISDGVDKVTGKKAAIIIV